MRGHRGRRVAPLPSYSSSRVLDGVRGWWFGECYGLGSLPTGAFNKGCAASEAVEKAGMAASKMLSWVGGYLGKNYAIKKLVLKLLPK